MTHTIREHPGDGATMVLVPAGPFQMGMPDGDFLAENHEKPEREVHLPDFWIDIHPVTNARFADFLYDGGYETAEWWCKDGWEWLQFEDIENPAMWFEPGWDGPDQPVAGVSWYEADAFCRWAGKRLPTDAEWEKAARGSDGRRYPWGNEWPTYDLANYDSHFGRTSPVGLYPDGVSPYGCHDMAGNVNNWVYDWYWPDFGRYCVDRQMTTSPRLDDETRVKIAPLTILQKIDRGGGYATPREMHEVLSCTRKVYWVQETRQPWNGFRSACDSDEES